MKIAGSGAGSGFGSIGNKHGSADPDPYQNVTDPQHCLPHGIVNGSNKKIRKDWGA